MNPAALHRLLGPASSRRQGSKPKQDDIGEPTSSRPGYGQLCLVLSRALQEGRCGEGRDSPPAPAAGDTANTARDGGGKAHAEHHSSLENRMSPLLGKGEAKAAHPEESRKQHSQEDLRMATPYRMLLTPLHPSPNSAEHVATTPMSVATSLHRRNSSSFVEDLLTPLSAMAISEPPSTSRQQRGSASSMLTTPQSTENLRAKMLSPYGSAIPETPRSLLQPFWDMPERPPSHRSDAGGRRQHPEVQLWSSERRSGSGSISDGYRYGSDTSPEMEVMCGQAIEPPSAGEHTLSTGGTPEQSDNEPRADSPAVSSESADSLTDPSSGEAIEPQGLVFQNWTQLELQESEESPGGGAKLSCLESDLQKRPAGIQSHGRPPCISEDGLIGAGRAPEPETAAADGSDASESEAPCVETASMEVPCQQDVAHHHQNPMPILRDIQPEARTPDTVSLSGASRQDEGGVPQTLDSKLQGCTFFWRQQEACDFADRCNASLSRGQDSACQGAVEPGSQQARVIPRKSSKPDEELNCRRAADMHTACFPGAVQVFCSEIPRSKGGYSRQFVAGTMEAIWQHYSNTAPQERHLYEVIRENQPCKLYCDLEYYKECNPQLDGDKMVDILVELLVNEIMARWGIQLSPNDDILELDSSTATKFSRHLIANVPGSAFCSNGLVGAVVGQCATDTRLHVNKEGAESTRTPFVDMAVYTRNRHFRIYLSSKSNKHARLLPTERYSAWRHSTSKALLLASLIGSVPEDAKILDCPELHWSGPPQTFIWSQTLSGGQFLRLDTQIRTFGTFSKSLSRSEGLDEQCQLLKLFIEEAGTARYSSCGRAACRAKALNLLGFGSKSCAEGRCGHLLRAPAGRHVRRAGGLQVGVNSIAACPTGDKLLLSTVGPGSHYCENVERLHKSNHVYFVVDLAQGIYAQKCYDPDCRHYRSLWLPVPKHLLGKHHIRGQDRRPAWDVEERRLIL